MKCCWFPRTWSAVSPGPSQSLEIWVSRILYRICNFLPIVNTVVTVSPPTRLHHHLESIIVPKHERRRRPIRVIQWIPRRVSVIYPFWIVALVLVGRAPIAIQEHRRIASSVTSSWEDVVQALRGVLVAWNGALKLAADSHEKEIHRSHVLE